jgi:hypothetical protein
MGVCVQRHPPSGSRCPRTVPLCTQTRELVVQGRCARGHEIVPELPSIRVNFSAYLRKAPERNVFALPFWSFSYAYRLRDRFGLHFIQSSNSSTVFATFHPGDSNQPGQAGGACNSFAGGSGFTHQTQTQHPQAEGQRRRVPRMRESWKTLALLAGSACPPGDEQQGRLTAACREGRL